MMYRPNMHIENNRAEGERRVVITGIGAVTIRDGKVAPTINFETRDPSCDLDYVPNRARTQPVRGSIPLRDQLCSGLPGAITLASLFCGFGAILFAGAGLLVPACLAIGVSTVCDGLDGWAARKLGVASRSGVELDSLSDIVAFGLAPAVLMVRWAFLSGGGALCVLAALVYQACAAGRLARFNVSAPGQGRFTGLPTPGAAGTVAALVGFHVCLHPTWPVLWIAAITLVALGGLMISRIAYIDIRRFVRTSHRLDRIAMAAWVVFVCCCPAAGFLLLASFYTVSGPFAALLERKRP